jgi:hypothetical protein
MSWMEFVSNLVHWLAIPAAIVVVCWLFRERIRDLIDRVNHIEAPGGISADLDPMINNVLGQAGQVGLQLTAEPQISVGASITAGEVRIGEVEVSQSPSPEELAEQEELRRAEIEVIMDIAAKWGWTQASSGLFQQPMHPIVEWSDTGRPSILAGTSDATKYQAALRRVLDASPPGVVGFPTVRLEDEHT